MKDVFQFTEDHVRQALHAIDHKCVRVWAAPGAVRATAYLQEATTTDDVRCADIILDTVLRTGARKATIMSYAEFVNPSTQKFFALVDAQTQEGKDVLDRYWVQFPWEDEVEQEPANAAAVLEDMQLGKKCIDTEPLRALIDACHGNANVKGFWNYTKSLEVGTEAYNDAVCRLLLLVGTEISEACEGLRKEEPDPHVRGHSNFEVELADTVIRIFDMAGGLKLDLVGAIAMKMEANQKRPMKHGKNF